MEALKRIEMVLKNEDELKEKYRDWEIVGIDMRSNAARHSYRRFRDKETNSFLVTCSHESISGNSWESNTYDWKENFLGTLNTIEDMNIFPSDNWITYVAVRRDNTIIHAEITDGKIFK